MEGSGLCGFAGNVGALFGVEGLGDAVEVEAFLAELLEKVGHENRLRNTSGGNEARVFSVAKSAGGKFGGAVVRQLPREDIEGRKPSHSCFSRPLCGLDCTVELVAVQGVGVPVVVGLVPRILDGWSGGWDVRWRWSRCRAGAGSWRWWWAALVGRRWWSDWVGCGEWWRGWRWELRL